MLREHLARLGAHLADAEGAEQPREAGGLALFNGVHQVLGGFFAHAVELRHILRAQVVDAGGRGEQPGGDQRLGHRRAQALDVHRLAAGEVDDVAQALGGAFGTGAAHRDAVLVPHDGRAALRAAVGQAEGDGALGALGFHDLQHLGDDLPGLADEHGVSDADVELVDEVLVVQRGVRHRGAGQAHGLDDGLGREHARAAHLHGDVPHDALLHLGGIFIGHGPARRLGRAAELSALGEGVDLDDRAVDAVGEGVPPLADGVYPRAALGHAAAGRVRHHGEAVALQGVQRLDVRGEFAALGALDVENDDVQLARGGHFGVLLAHGAGGGVARVGEELLAALRALFVQLVEHGVGHVHLAADYEPLREAAAKLLRQAAHSAQVFRHVLASDAVPARRAADENAVFILEGHGEAVDFRLDAVFAPLRQGGGHALVEGGELLEGEHVRQALERHLVLHGGEAALRRAAHALAGGVGVVKLGVGGLQLLQAAHQRVVLKVGDDRRVLVVIMAVVFKYFGPEGLYLAFCVHVIAPC